MILVDTNLLSFEALGRARYLFTSSVSAQELLGMQRPNKEKGYQYALPLLRKSPYGIGPLGGREWSIPDYRYLQESAGSAPVSKGADRITVPRSLLGPEMLELGHAAVADAHQRGLDGIFRTYAEGGLNKKVLKKVLKKWEFLRTCVEAIIPLDEEISAQGAILADQFVNMGYSPKGTARNTMNDMLIAATAKITERSLMTRDKQLGNFYRKIGWSVTEGKWGMTATPPRLSTPPQQVIPLRSESRGYINRPAYLRTDIDYNRFY